MRESNSGITLSDILETYKLLSKNAEGVTLWEIANHLGISNRQVRERVKRLIAEGRWEYKGQKMMPTINGRLFPTDCYGPKS